MQAQLPPVLRNSYDYLAVINALAKELELLEASIEIVRAQFNPLTADVLLNAWEWELKLPVGGGGATTDVRRANVLARLRKVLSGGEGREWQDTISELLGPGWSYLEHDPAHPTNPPAAGVILITVPFPSGSSRFIEAQNQIRDITDAHLEIDFQSTASFDLDVSELDVNQFGS